jgi:hypothetical protein
LEHYSYIQQFKEKSIPKYLVASVRSSFSNECRSEVVSILINNKVKESELKRRQKIKKKKIVTSEENK